MYEPRGIKDTPITNYKAYTSSWYGDIAESIGLDRYDKSSQPYEYKDKYKNKGGFSDLSLTARKVSSFMAPTRKLCLTKEQKNYFDMNDTRKKGLATDHPWGIYIQSCLEDEEVGVGEKVWTTFKKYKDLALPHHQNSKTYTENQFISFNMRASNDYMHVKRMAYTVNLHPFPDIKHYFQTAVKRGKKPVQLNSDMYATGELLQWVFRSRLRNGGKIDLFITSIRMRNLMRAWMKNIGEIRDRRIDEILEHIEQVNSDEGH